MAVVVPSDKVSVKSPCWRLANEREGALIAGKALALAVYIGLISVSCHSSLFPPILHLLTIQWSNRGKARLTPAFDILARNRGGLRQQPYCDHITQDRSHALGVQQRCHPLFAPPLLSHVRRSEIRIEPRQTNSSRARPSESWAGHPLI